MDSREPGSLFGAERIGYGTLPLLSDAECKVGVPGMDGGLISIIICGRVQSHLVQVGRRCAIVGSMIAWLEERVLVLKGVDPFSGHIFYKPDTVQMSSNSGESPRHDHKPLKTYVHHTSRQPGRRVRTNQKDVRKVGSRWI